MEDFKYLTEVQVSEILQRALQTLRNDRHRGQGIPYYKVGRSVRYSMADVRKFMEERRIETSGNRALTNN